MNQTHHGSGDNVQGNKNINVKLPYWLGVLVVLTVFFSYYIFNNLNNDHYSELYQKDYIDLVKTLDQVSETVSILSILEDIDSVKYIAAEESFDRLRQKINSQEVTPEFKNMLGAFYSQKNKFLDPGSDITQDDLKSLSIVIEKEIKHIKSRFKKKINDHEY